MASALLVSTRSDENKKHYSNYFARRDAVFPQIMKLTFNFFFCACECSALTKLSHQEQVKNCSFFFGNLYIGLDINKNLKIMSISLFNSPKKVYKHENI